MKAMQRVVFNWWTVIGLIISTILTIGIWTIVGTPSKKADISARHTISYSKVDPDVVQACGPEDKDMNIIVHFKAHRTMGSHSHVNRWIINKDGVVVATTWNQGHTGSKPGLNEARIQVKIPCLEPGVYTHNSISINCFPDGATSMVPAPESKFTVVKRQ